jgi:enoyl-CoA hydratase/carnithine racemase
MLATLKTEENVSIITLDDGKVNAFSPAMIAEVDSLLDQVPTDKGALMFTGREGMFTAGFDLKVMATDPDAAVGMIKSGFKMLQRIFSFQDQLYRHARVMQLQWELFYFVAVITVSRRMEILRLEPMN